MKLSKLKVGDELIVVKGHPTFSTSAFTAGNIHKVILIDLQKGYFQITMPGHQEWHCADYRLDPTHRDFTFVLNTPASKVLYSK